MLPLIIPILSQVLKDPNAGRRQGVCIGLSEVMASAVKSQLLIFMDELIPTYVAWEALSRVIGSVPKEGGPVVIPGFCLPKALQPLLPIFLQGLTSGSAELREQATLGLGELIEVTSEKALKDFVIPITGIMEREKQLSILYQKTRSGNPFSSKATCEQRLQKIYAGVVRIFL
ncbi:hypothetical protein NC651_038462 [Populus alba x Populus x berolinensis]|nr:hypothetical protein NC651_038462 [Populus alba x Populus x berolinensis]